MCKTLGYASFHLTSDDDMEKGSHRAQQRVAERGRESGEKGGDNEERNEKEREVRGGGDKDEWREGEKEGLQERVAVLKGSTQGKEGEAGKLRGFFFLFRIW